MLVGDVLQLVGALRMDQFEWGSSFVDACNRRLAPHTTNSLPVILITMTGVEVRDSLYRLPTKEMTEFLLREFDLGSQILLPLPLVDDSSVKRRPILTLKKTKLKKPVTVKVKTKNRSTMALFLGAALVVLALLLAVSMSSATVDAGALPDKEAVQSIVDIILDVVHAYLNPRKPPDTSQYVL